MEGKTEGTHNSYKVAQKQKLAMLEMHTAFVVTGYYTQTEFDKRMEAFFRVNNKE